MIAGRTSMHILQLPVKTSRGMQIREPKAVWEPANGYVSRSDNC